MSCQICKCYTPVIMCYVLYNYRSLNNTFFIYIVEPRFILRQQQERHRRKWTTSQSGKGKCMYVDFLIVLSYTICEQQGCKGNKIHILNQGSRDTTSDDAETKIQPCNLDEMTPNEQDLVKQQIEQIKPSHVNVGTQTYPVIVTGPEELLSAMNPNGSSAVMAILAQIQDTQTEMLDNLKALCDDMQEMNNLLNCLKHV